MLEEARVRNKERKEEWEKQYAITVMGRDIEEVTENLRSNKHTYRKNIEENKI